MKEELVERLRASFARPERWTQRTCGARAARAQSLLREHVVSRLDRAVVDAGLRALVVKGEALARTVYPEPWMRSMSDIDLVVCDEDEERVVEAMVSAGFMRGEAPEGRELSGRLLYETCLALPVGDGGFAVEVHTSLDKIVKRDIDFRQVMSRASPLGDALLLPSHEDELLLVVLHMATSDFDHPIGWLDLHQLLGETLDVHELLRRARRWGLRTALFVAMNGLRLAGSERVPPALIEESRPGQGRRRWLERYFDLRRFPPQVGARRDGIPWVVRQIPLWDDPVRWLVGCGRYGAWRIAERLGATSRA